MKVAWYTGLILNLSFFGLYIGAMDGLAIQDWQKIIHDEQLFCHHLDQKNISSEILNTPNHDNLMPLDIFWERRLDKNHIIEKLVDCGATQMSWDSLAKVDIHREASRGNYAVVKLAVMHNPHLAHKLSHGVNPINAAARGCHCLVPGNKHADIIHLLLTYGVATTLVDQCKESPLHHAASYGENNILYQLLQHSSVRINDGNNDGLTPLHSAAMCRWESRQVECMNSVALLYQYGADIDRRDGEGRTPLIIAVQCGNLMIVEYLLQMCNVRCNIADNEGNFAVHYAMQAKTKNACPIFSLLLKYASGTLLDVKNKQNRTPIEELQNAKRQSNEKKDKAEIFNCNQMEMILAEYLAQRK